MDLTVKEAATRLKVSERLIQKRCKLILLTKIGNTYSIPAAIFNQWLNDQQTNENEQTNEYEITEYFTAEEYEVFKSRLSEYPNLLKEIDYLKNQVEYLRKSLDRHSDQMELLLQSMNKSLGVMVQRNTIEWKEKNEQ